MRIAKNIRAAIIGLLIFSTLVAFSQGFVISPSYAQMSVQSNSHTHTGGPPGLQSTTTTSVSTGAASSSSHHRNGRNGGVPLGLENAWAHSNMSVVARAVTHAIFLNGTHGVELAEIAIAASNNGQLIRNVAFNESVAKIDFDRDGAVELEVNSSTKPTAVFADNNELSESQFNFGLSPNSNVWVYDQNSHVLTIYADPSSITIFYGSSPQTPVPEIPGPIAAVLLLGTLLAAGLALQRRSRRPIPTLA